MRAQITNIGKYSEPLLININYLFAYFIYETKTYKKTYYVIWRQKVKVN